MEASAEIGGGHSIVRRVGGGAHLDQDVTQQLPELAHDAVQLSAAEGGPGSGAEEEKLLLRVAGAAEGEGLRPDGKHPAARLPPLGQGNKIGQGGPGGNLGQKPPRRGVGGGHRTLANQDRSLREGVQQGLY